MNSKAIVKRKKASDTFRKLTAVLLIWCVVVSVSIISVPGTTRAATYQDSTLSVEERVNDLLSRMTLDEKIGQMTQVERNSATPTDVATYFIGSVLSGGGSNPTPNTPTAWADMVDSYQQAAMSTRLQVPIIYGVDAVHGHNNVVGATIFPHNIGLGATRDPDVVKRAAEITAKEVRTTGVHWSFAPCLCVPQDERWGRTYEGFAETPDLVSQMGVAATQGLQGLATDSNFLKGTKVVASVKHWVGDGNTVDGDDQGNVTLTEEEMQPFIQPYKDAIAAGARTVMVSLSSWKGVKTHGDYHLITEVLKGQLGFTGIVVSDWNGIDPLDADYTTAVKKGVNAGMDLFMVPGSWKSFIPALKNLVNTGQVSQVRIDDAVRRIITVKFEAELFEKPYADRTLLSEGSFGSAAHRAVARETVRKSAVLLKNENKILPLSKNLSKVFVAGKKANDIGYQSGGWTISWQGSTGNITPGTTILQGIQSAVSSSTTVTHSLDGLGAAGSDVAVVIIGEEPYAEWWGDRTDLALSSEDITLLNNVKASGVPMVVILLSGRPMIVTNQLPDWKAFISAWLPGTEGNGISDVLFGDYGFTGKLPVTWPASMSQIPMNIGSTNNTPLFPYGYGLTTADVPSYIEAEKYTTMSGVQTEITLDTYGGLNVGYIDTGDWMDYSVNIPTSGTYTVRMRTASLNGAANAMQLRKGTSTLATFSAPATGGWQNWTTVQKDVTLSAGTQTFRVQATAGGWNINWLEFAPKATIATGQSTAQVWFSSEKEPANMSWYTAPYPIAYTLSQQSDVGITDATKTPMTTINVDPDVRYQSILGVGTSLEESTIYNLSKMTAAKRDEILTKLVDPINGAGMNFMRITFGTSDFTSRTFYSYNDMPAGETDPTLSNFSIQKDIDYNIIATVKRALELNPNLKIFGSSWSAPGWMKTNDNLVRGAIKTEYLDELATYYRKAIQAYEALGIPIYSMTMQNEPLLEIDYPSMYMSPDQQRQFSILLKNELNAYNLGTKLWIFDHNFSDAWYYVPPILDDATANAAVDGVAFHDYSGSPYTMTEIHNAYPTKKVMLSERSLWGTYGMDRIAQFFRNWAISYNAWVTMLDSNIAPEQWVGTPDPTLLIQDASDVNNYWITPEYYMTGQFSKFIQRDAKRISSNYGSTNAVTNVSFLNPDNTIVTVVINQSANDQTFKIVEGIEGAKEIIATIPAKAVATYKWTRLTGSSPAPTPEPEPTPTPTPTPDTLTNPGFETGNTNGWGEWHGGPLAQKVDTENPHSGSYKLVHWASSAYTQLTYQSPAVTNGTYKASVWVRSGGGQNALHLYVKNYGGSELQATIGSSPVSGWTQYIIDNINVTNSQIEIGVWSDANGNNWAVFDDFELVKK